MMKKAKSVCAIASPLADGKLTKKGIEIVKKGKQMNKSGGRGDIRGRRRGRTSPSFCSLLRILLLLRVLFSLFGGGSIRC